MIVKLTYDLSRGTDEAFTVMKALREYSDEYNYTLNSGGHYVYSITEENYLLMCLNYPNIEEYISRYKVWDII